MLPAAAITVAGWMRGANLPTRARAARFSRSIATWKRRIPARTARSVSAARSDVPTPCRCHSSVIAIATSAASKSSWRRT